MINSNWDEMFDDKILVFERRLKIMAKNSSVNVNLHLISLIFSLITNYKWKYVLCSKNLFIVIKLIFSLQLRNEYFWKLINTVREYSQIMSCYFLILILSTPPPRHVTQRHKPPLPLLKCDVIYVKMTSPLP